MEGTAATNYAIGTFHVLHPLIFVHGFWSYNRIVTLLHWLIVWITSIGSLLLFPWFIGPGSIFYVADMYVTLGSPGC